MNYYERKVNDLHKMKQGESVSVDGHWVDRYGSMFKVDIDGGGFIMLPTEISVLEFIIDCENMETL